MFFANYSVKELSALASTLAIPGRSKMGKAALLAAISEVIGKAHLEALSMQPKSEQDKVTMRELLTITGWKRVPRKYKKLHRKLGHLA